MTKQLNKQVLDAIFAGQWADLFSVCGVHASEKGSVIRACLPGAENATVVNKYDGHPIAEMSRVDCRGFFVADTALKQPVDYQLEVNWGKVRERIEDPYRFTSRWQEHYAWLFAEGKLQRPYEMMGAHAIIHEGVEGINFCVWAPNARRVSVVGDFNDWDGRRHVMRLHPQNGVWELFLPQASIGQCYKYEILDANGEIRLKADPYAFAAQLRPHTASIISELPDVVEMTQARLKANAADAPISIYEVHLGSWRRKLENNYWLSYRELTDELLTYVKQMGFTHIELLPIHEFPFDGSWGYQPTGLYAPTSRFGQPSDLCYLIEQAHANQLNVIIDWVPGHFPTDDFGLARFDGTPLYEHEDPREGYHQDWNTLIYNYGRNEVRNFLTGNALYWLERFGVDGLRVDAVASMIYRDYSRDEGEWVANQYGGRENLEAIEFLKQTNALVAEKAPGCLTIAEESTAFCGVSHPLSAGGLGFDFKWNMGWMNDTLAYMQEDPVHRKFHHQKLTFGMVYQYSERFVLPISHDEVVHGKGSMLDKMPGDTWQRFANLRAYYGYMWGYPGKKLLFMGCEFAQGREWNYQESLDWYLLEEQYGGKWHSGVQRLVRDLNHCYTHIPALHELDADPAGFEWLIADDNESSVFAFERRDRHGNAVMVISNFTPVLRHHYRIGVHREGLYREIINTDSVYYNGSDVSNTDAVWTEQASRHGKPYSIALTLPPLATLMLRFISK